MRQNKAWLQDILFQNVSATENVKVTKRIRPQNVSAQNLHLQSVSAQNLHLQNVSWKNYDFEISLKLFGSGIQELGPSAATRSGC